jgi:phospholipid/cholesterol/gamma-HCH transport system permease protein
MPDDDSSVAPPGLRIRRSAENQVEAEVLGDWNLRSLVPRLHSLQAALRQCSAEMTWDLSGLSALDHAGALLLWRAWDKRRPQHVRMDPQHERFFEHLAKMAPPPRRRRRRPGFPVEVLGRHVLSAGDHTVGLIQLTGSVALSAARLARRLSAIPWREISANVYRTGAQALGITALVGFLVGVVLSYLSAQQLRTFGADIYIVNLLGVSVLRELGPVLAAILVAGRSGSAMTAQLGIMRVTQELDAMSVMGIPHTRRLVLPKIIALAVAMPLIILWTNAIALVGGMVAARAKLGISYHYFLENLPSAVPVANFWLGIGKGFVFGMLIALIACHFGLRIKPNTTSLGTGTTNSVVTAITIVILADAVFAVMFSDVGIFT